MGEALLVILGLLLVHDADQPDVDLRRVVAPQRIAQEPTLHLHLDLRPPIQAL